MVPLECKMPLELQTSITELKNQVPFLSKAPWDNGCMGLNAHGHSCAGMKRHLTLHELQAAKDPQPHLC